MKFIQVVFFTLLLGSWTSLLAQSAASENEFTDPRDGKVYKTVKIGEQVWMADNLRHNLSGTYCYNNSTDNCERYGRLYDWNTAMEACPEGWHLPTSEEWEQLINNYPTYEEAYKDLIKDGPSGFNATLHGVYAPMENIFLTEKEHGSYWHATEYDGKHAWAQRFILNTTETYASQAPKVNTHGCRCVKDSE